MQNNDKKSLNSEITMKSELKKVVWPGAKKTAKSTAATIIFVLLISLILIVLNLFFDFISEKYYGFILKDDEAQKNNSVILSGDDISGDLAEMLKDYMSGEKSGEISGEAEPTESGNEVE